MKKSFFCLLILLGLLTGCHPQPKPESLESHIVCQIRVESTSHPELSRLYTSDAKMGKLLRYIRSLRNMPTAQAAAAEIPQPAAVITIIRADGSIKQYQQWGNLYFQGENAVWKQLPFDTGARLWQLLEDNPSDLENN